MITSALGYVCVLLVGFGLGVMFGYATKDHV